jgi:hypothetical protein
MPGLKESVMKLWQFRTRNFRVVLSCDWDNDIDLSWADEDELENIRSGLWGCYVFRVAVYDPQGVAIGESYLGGSVYENPADFRDHIGIKATGCGSYFSDMVREAVAEARQYWEERPVIKLRAYA